MSTGDLDLDAIAATWLQQCGSCDAGLPMSCSCNAGDPRPVMAALVDEVRRLRLDVLSLKVQRTWLLAEVDDRTRNRFHALRGDSQ